MARGMSGDRSLEVAARAIAIGVAANTALKLALLVVLGAASFRIIAGGTLAAMFCGRRRMARVCNAALEIFPTLRNSRRQQAVEFGHLRRFAGISVGMPLAFSTGMKHRLLHSPPFSSWSSASSAPRCWARTPQSSVDVEHGADKTYVVDAAFDVNVPASLAWEVLTDYEGIGRFVSSIRQSTIQRREAGRVLLEQHGVGRAWIVSLPMHVVLDVREHDQRMLVFRDVCGKSFTTYEGTWELTTIGGGTRVTYRLTADPTRPAARDAREVCHQGQRKEAAR